MKALITMPDYDTATSYLCCYAEELVRFAENNGISISQMKRPRLRRESVEAVLIKQRPHLLLFNAHGDEQTIYGDKLGSEEEYLIRESKNHQLLDGKMTYARACSAAASLGKTVKNGCFIGYNQPFSFWTDITRTTTPLKDNVARLFLQPSNDLAIALLKGKSACAAADIFISQSKKNILYLLGKQDELGAMASATLLWSNMMAQEVIGNEEMSCS